MTWFAIIFSFIAGIATERARSSRAIRKRQAKADELRFLMSLTIPHSVEDAVRRAGC